MSGPSVYETKRKERKLFELPVDRNRVVRFDELVAIIGRPRSSIYLMISRGEFPKAKKIGARAVGWMSHDIDHWLSQR
jgi:prophage regulatory protein